MLKGQSIFILSLMKFDGLASTNFTIAKYLAKNNDVYYIEHPLTLKDFFKLDKTSMTYLSRKNGLKLRSSGLLRNKIGGVNIIISYPILPINFIPPGKLYNFFLSINEKIAAKRVRRIIEKRKIQNVVYINAYDFRFPDFGKMLKPNISVYYCVDPIVGDYDKKHGTTTEQKIIKDADIVICTSRALYEEHKKLNSNCYFVPNGADIVNRNKKNIFFDTHLLPPKIKRPVIGYLGAIERRIDYALIKTIAHQHSEWNFVFVGPIYKDHIPQWFFNQENIHIMAPVSYSEVPAIIELFDVCMIPFKKDAISNTIFPLKLFEYLGVGKPVVTTNFNDDLREFCETVVLFSSDAISFATNIEEALENNNEEAINERLRIALKNTWKERVSKISEIIGSHLILSK